MIKSIEREDMEDLIGLLENVVEVTSNLTGSNEAGNLELEQARQCLQTLTTVAAMLELHPIERAGTVLLDYLEDKIISGAPDAATTIPPFSLAVRAILDEIKEAAEKGFEELNPAIDAIVEMLPSAVPSSSGNEKASELRCDEMPPFEADYLTLKQLTENLGGSLEIQNGSNTEPVLHMRFPADTVSLHRLQTLLSQDILSSANTMQLVQSDSRVERVLNMVREFMLAFSKGAVKDAQKILLELAEQQQQAGLYKQIGTLARQLHDSIKGFVETLDSALVDMVEDKIPDSGSRLEHILQLTENAANVTLDHVEVMQQRNQVQQNLLKELFDKIGSLKAVGDGAREMLAEAQKIVEELQSSVMLTSADLITVLTAQDYQDLTGQIILKIINLLRELELKLVNVIQTFGVRLEGDQKKKQASDELYGPAHEGRLEALSSQDDVDSLLAEFGF